MSADGVAGTRVQKSRSKFSSRLYSIFYSIYPPQTWILNNYIQKNLLWHNNGSISNSYLQLWVISSSIAGSWCEIPSAIAACPKSTQVTIQWRLDKMGGARPHPGIWTELGGMWTLNWNWTATDDVSQVHKNTSTDKNADWERPSLLVVLAPKRWS